MAFNIYQMITDRILEMLENGVVAWRKAWQGGEAINYVTRKAYRGINTLLLDRGGEYLTFKQCQDCGGKVKKGAKSNLIVFFKPIEKENNENPEEKEIGFVLRYSRVFHISDCEGIESKLEFTEDTNKIEPLEMGENIINNYISKSNIKFENDSFSNNAYYSPNADKIVVPMLSQYTNVNEYYSTVFHEMAHSTGHTSRLNRLSKQAYFGNAEYSREELIAEITSAMLMNVAGLEIPSTFENSVAYINGWKKKLREDKNAVVVAAGQAQKACDYILA